MSTTIACHFLIETGPETNWLSFCHQDRYRTEAARQKNEILRDARYIYGFGDTTEPQLNRQKCGAEMQI